MRQFIIYHKVLCQVAGWDKNLSFDQRFVDQKTSRPLEEKNSGFKGGSYELQTRQGNSLNSYARSFHYQWS